MSCSVVCCTSSVERNRRPLCSKNGPPAVSCTAAKCSWSSGESGSQSPGAVIGKLRRCAVDHDQERVHLLRKCRIELQFALAPGQPRRDELAGVGVDGKIFLGEEHRAESEQQVEDERQRGPRSADPEDLEDCGLDHDQSAGIGIKFASISHILAFPARGAWVSVLKRLRQQRSVGASGGKPGERVLSRADD